MTESPAAAGLSRAERTHEIAAIVLLIRAKVVPMERLAALIEEFGSAVAVVNDVEKQRAAAPTYSTDDVAEAVATVETWLKRGLDVRTVLDRAYPFTLRTVFNRPPLLFFKGEWDEARDRSAIAIVGTRKASPEGLRRAEKAAQRLAKASITVLSGLAKGIDTAAHRGALAGGGRTVAVMGTGINRIYPAENADLATDIVRAGGALVSQFLPDQPPTQWTFPLRNVVMSGLSVATLVIEASATSGAKSQARRALEHGRTVFLPKPLVESHEWAAKMATEGIGGVKAIQVDSVGAIIDRITGSDIDEKSVLAFG